MTTLSNSKVVMLYFDEEEAPNRDDDRQSFVYGAEGDLYVVQVNWKRPVDGILASVYNENNREHVDRVACVLRQMYKALLEFLNDIDSRVSQLPGILQPSVGEDTQERDCILIDGKVHYKSTVVKTGVATLHELVEFLVGEFTNTIGLKIGISNGCNPILLNQDVYERELSDDEIVQFLPCLSYQMRMVEDIQSSIRVCDASKLQCLLRHGVLSCKNLIRCSVLFCSRFIDEVERPCT